MTRHGGYRPGAGRPVGSPNRLTRALVEAASDGLHPFEFLLAVVRDEAQAVETRIQAAKAALPYCAHRLHAVELVVDDAPRAVQEYTDTELMEFIRQGLEEERLPA